jgi:putative pyridoxal-dependent aspartate 1-decarboxylase
MTSAGGRTTSLDDTVRAVFGDADTELETLVDAELHRLLSQWPRPRGGRPHADRSDLTGTRVPLDPTAPAAYVRDVLVPIVDGAADLRSPRCLSSMKTVLPHAMPSLAALVTAMNQNLVKSEASPMLTRCERQVLGMLHRTVYGRSDDFYRRTVQSPDACLGMATTGGSLANLAAMWVARNSALPDVRERGLAAALSSRGAAGACIVGPASMHYSFAKAADLLGLGQQGLERVPLDRRGRMVVPELRRVVRRARDEGRVVVAVVAVAGSTDAGAVDCLEEAAGVAAEAGAHLHVDAAWGAPVLFSSRHRPLLRGIEQADTVTVDGHKELHAPTGVAAVLLREPHAGGAVEHAADYAVRPGSHDLGRRSLEGSRPGSVLLLHAALHLLGERGYEEVVDEAVRQAEVMSAAVRRRPELESLVDPQLNIVLYRYLPPWLRDGERPGPGDDPCLDALNTALHKQQRAAGRSQISRTCWDIGTPAGPRRVVALRAVLANPTTTDADIHDVLDEQVHLGDALARDVRAVPRLARPST